MRGDAESYKAGECAQSPSSTSVLHVGLAEDLCIWVISVVGGGAAGVGLFSLPLWLGITSYRSLPVNPPS